MVSELIGVRTINASKVLGIKLLVEFMLSHPCSRTNLHQSQTTRNILLLNLFVLGSTLLDLDRYFIY